MGRNRVRRAELFGKILQRSRAGGAIHRDNPAARRALFPDQGNLPTPRPRPFAAKRVWGGLIRAMKPA